MGECHHQRLTDAAVGFDPDGGWRLLLLGLCHHPARRNHSASLFFTQRAEHDLAISAVHQFLSRRPVSARLRQVDASGMKWVIITDVANGEPVFVLDAHHFLRDALFDELSKDPTAYWHRPIVIRDMKARLA